MSRAVVLDLVASPRRLTAAGAGLLAVGLLAAGALAVNVRDLGQRQAALAAELDARRPAPRPVAHRPADERAERDLAAMRRELALPWSKLLGELEAASHDAEQDVALLAVEPDPEKRVVHVKAESRSLSAALGYLERLQSSTALRYPMLESHEISKDDPEHPVRVQLVAEWRL
jgi:hypothetical protein